VGRVNALVEGNQDEEEEDRQHREERLEMERTLNERVTGIEEGLKGVCIVQGDERRTCMEENGQLESG
jgi:tRNA(Ser,Leu) C12 N-acetylase TAN1